LRVAVTIVLAAAVAITAVGSVVTVVRIGESGARAIWTGSFTENPR
jgi:FlaG/FlaF family flagellin (archaellin)